MIRRIFCWTADALIWLSDVTHLTYNEVNIIVYYMLIPLSWAVMLDFILHWWPVLTVLYVSFCLFITCFYRKHFRKLCDLAFDKSQDFLLWFRRIGWDYLKASDIICVFLPILIYAVLIYLLII